MVNEAATKMESPQAAFITMMMDRLHEIETKYDSLKMDVIDLRAENAAMREERDRLHLTPASNYTEFSDGARLVWRIDADPWQDGPQGKGYIWGPLDEAHKNAIIPWVPGPFILHVAGIRVREEIDQDINDVCVFAGFPGVTLTVQQFVDKITQWMNEPHLDGGTNFTKYIGVLNESKRKFVGICLPTADDHASGCMFLCIDGV
jgi:hypothetical protein